MPSDVDRVVEGASVARPMKVLALAASAFTMLVVVATAVLLTLDGGFGGDPLSNVLGLVGIGCYAAIGGLIAWRLPGNACGWLLIWIGGGISLGLFTDSLTTFALREGHVTLASWSDWANAWLLFGTLLPGIVLYLLVFPTGRPPSARGRPVVISVIILAVAGVLASILGPPSDEGIGSPTTVASLTPALEPLLAAILVGFVAAAVLGVASVVIRSRRAVAPERQQLRWLVAVAVLSAALLVGAIAFGALGLDRIGDPLGIALIWMLTTGLPVSAGVALLKHRLYGIEVVANRAIVYGSLAATISVIYAVIVAGVGAAVGSGDRPNVFAAVAATAVAAVAFQPVRRRAQRLADRLIYGDRASPYELLATFTERLDDASLHEVLPRMTALVAQGTGAERVRIWLRDATELRVVAAWPSDGVLPAPMRLDDGELPSLDDPAFAVRHGGDLLGAITVGMPPQEPMTPATERLLVDLSAQAGLVLRNVALVEELQRSRQRLVTSQDEARRRLERDLHDGAQQRLVTLSLDLRMARERAGASGDVELTTRIQSAEQGLAQSLAELRELARGIHPAILTQNGLGGALRSLAERSAVPVELRSAPKGRFSPEVEATAYFIVSEALANVAKHAEASRAWVAVEDGGNRLAIEVRDDGVGGATMGGGSGLLGLADRVEAVGGRIDVRSEPGSGSVVLAEIPCASR
jgi:signal transduction histidine kinase